MCPAWWLEVGFTFADCCRLLTTARATTASQGITHQCWQPRAEAHSKVRLLPSTTPQNVLAPSPAAAADWKTPWRVTRGSMSLALFRGRVALPMTLKPLCRRDDLEQKQSKACRCAAQAFSVNCGAN